MFEQLKEFTVNYVDVEPEDIKPESRFIDDLGFNSYDFMSLLGDLETELDVVVDDDYVNKSVKYYW